MKPSIQLSRAIKHIIGFLLVACCLLTSILVVIMPDSSLAAGHTLTINPDADTSIDQGSPNKAAPTSHQLLAVGGKNERQAFLRFTLDTLPVGTSIQSAKLRLVVTNDSSSGGVIATMHNTSWAENMTWNKRPTIDGAMLTTLGPVTINQVVEIDLTRVLSGSGTYSFAVTGALNNSNTVGYASRENSQAANRPQLIVVLQSGSSAAPTAVPPKAPTSAPTVVPSVVPTAMPSIVPTAVPTAVSNIPVANAANTMILVQPGSGYLAGPELEQRKQLAAQGVEPYKTALNDLLSFANKHLSSNPSPQQPLNIPDTSGPFVDDTATAYGLALAYKSTGDVRYAQKARDFIMAWVQKTKTTSNTCPDSGSCQTSLIIGRAGPGFVFAAELIQPSGVFSAADDTAFRNWLRTVILPTASLRTNNWGDAGTFLRVAVADYLGDTVGFNAAIDKWKALVDLIAEDGHIPEETRRDSSGINYTQEALDYKIAVVLIAQRRGIDLWSYGRFKRSVDYVAPYVLNSSAWPWASGASSSVHPLWEIAYQHWREPAYQPIIAKSRPYGANGHSALRWVTFTNGIPFN